MCASNCNKSPRSHAGGNHFCDFVMGPLPSGAASNCPRVLRREHGREMGHVKEIDGGWCIMRQLLTSFARATKGLRVLWKDHLLGKCRFCFRPGGAATRPRWTG